jgi:hypothetical protein
MLLSNPNHERAGGEVDLPRGLRDAAAVPRRLAENGPGWWGRHAEWSSIAVLPSGVVLNVQVVHHPSRTHDRGKSIDLEKRTVTLSLLDGFQGGKQSYYYHLVTDVSEALPAALENGVHTPRLAKVPGHGASRPADRSALLGFSPVLNGVTDTKTVQDQGVAASIANGGIDPINVFPITRTTPTALKRTTTARSGART